jgi:hypothetical protein
VNIAEDTTTIYSQNGGTLPASVNIAFGGTASFVARSLAGPNVEGVSKPVDAKIKTTNYPLYGGASLVIPQWITPPANIHALACSGVYACVQARVMDIFTPATGDKRTVLSAISTYTIGAVDAGGTTTGTTVVINPYFVTHRLDSITTSICEKARTKAFTATVLHEARHAYQYLQSQVPGNDVDNDDLLINIPIAPISTLDDSSTFRDVCQPSAVGGTILSKAYKGPTVPDTYQAPDYASYAVEMDAYTFADIHQN